VVRIHVHGNKARLTGTPNQTQKAPKGGPDSAQRTPTRTRILQRLPRLPILVSVGHTCTAISTHIPRPYTPIPSTPTHPQPFEKLMRYPQLCIFPGQVTSLEISHMYFIKLYVFNMYLNNICSDMERGSDTYTENERTVYKRRTTSERRVYEKCNGKCKKHAREVNMVMYLLADELTHTHVN
jgi:hypothetical protein